MSASGVLLHALAATPARLPPREPQLLVNGVDANYTTSKVFVDEGPVMKRMHARAKGRGSRILKRTSHITVVVGAGK